MWYLLLLAFVIWLDLYEKFWISKHSGMRDEYIRLAWIVCVEIMELVRPFLIVGILVVIMTPVVSGMLCSLLPGFFWSLNQRPSRFKSLWMKPFDCGVPIAFRTNEVHGFFSLMRNRDLVGKISYCDERIECWFVLAWWQSLNVHHAMEWVIYRV